DDLVLQLVVLGLREERAQELSRLFATTLPEPEDGLLTHVNRNVLAAGVVAQRRAGAIVSATALRQCEDRLVLDILVLRRLEDVHEQVDGAIAARLAEPEDGLLTGLLVRIILGGG